MPDVDALKCLPSDLVSDFQVLYRKWQWAERQQLRIDEEWLKCFALSGSELNTALHDLSSYTAHVRAAIYSRRVRLVNHPLYPFIRYFRSSGDLIALW
ncbi:hypothetical protein PENSPDRAFT_694101 [Peniophora sp. CONT]|nr:hypothetical protein PENSPDRAFT_694101 [Peniophora sp. CONT]